MQPYFNCSHHLFLDNFYNSPDLCHSLKLLKTDVTGTVKSSRRGLPSQIKGLLIRKGETIAFETDNLHLAIFSDKKNICVLSTCHTNEFETRTIYAKK